MSSRPRISQTPTDASKGLDATAVANVSNLGSLLFKNLDLTEGVENVASDENKTSIDAPSALIPMGEAKDAIENAVAKAAKNTTTPKMVPYEIRGGTIRVPSVIDTLYNNLLSNHKVDQECDQRNDCRDSFDTRFNAVFHKDTRDDPGEFASMIGTLDTKSLKEAIKKTNATLKLSWEATKFEEIQSSCVTPNALKTSRIYIHESMVRGYALNTNNFLSIPIPEASDEGTKNQFQDVLVIDIHTLKRDASDGGKWKIASTTRAANWLSAHKQATKSA